MASGTPSPALQKTALQSRDIEADGESAPTPAVPPGAFPSPGTSDALNAKAAELQNGSDVPWHVYSTELRALFSLCGPLALSGFLMYARLLISLMFLGLLGAVPLAGERSLMVHLDSPIALYCRGSNAAPCSGGVQRFCVFRGKDLMRMHSQAERWAVMLLARRPLISTPTLLS
jgi:hypothetical protein